MIIFFFIRRIKGKSIVDMADNIAGYFISN